MTTLKSHLTWRQLGRRVAMLLGVPLFAALLLFGLCPRADAQDSPTGPTNREQLEQEKLREEIRKLRREGSTWSRVPGLAGALTGLVAVGGLIFTALKYLQDRQKDREQREAEGLRRVAESFDRCTANLGSDSQGLQASAAVALLTFLDEKPEHQPFLEQVFLLALAQLKVHHADPVHRLLLRVFEKSARRYLPTVSDEDRRLILDLARMDLDRVNLSGVNLSGADLAFAHLRFADLSGAETDLRKVEGREVVLDKARLSRANLEEARLKGASAVEAQFHESNLVSARLGEANLQRAEFQRARLQGVDFRGANLEGAAFQGATVGDADFRGATLDHKAIRQLRGAHWKGAPDLTTPGAPKLDPATRSQLQSIAQNEKQ